MKVVRLLDLHIVTSVVLQLTTTVIITLPPECRGEAAIFDLNAEALIESSWEPVVVKVSPERYPNSDAVNEYWDRVSDHFNNGRGRSSNSVWSAVCLGKANDTLLCRRILSGGGDIGLSFWTWDGDEWKPFTGEQSLQALSPWIEASLLNTKPKPDAKPKPDRLPVVAEAENEADDEVDGAIPLFLASLKGESDRVKSILKKDGNINVNWLTDDGISSLYAAASNGHTEVVRILLQAGASVHLDNEETWVPLIVASREGHFAGIWPVLEEAGAVGSLCVESSDTATCASVTSGEGKPATEDRSNVEDAEEVRAKIIHVTYSSREAVPNEVWEQFDRFAGDHEVRFYDDDDCLAYLTMKFPEVVDKYLQLEMPAHRADLFRYAVMYELGGIYLDVKTVLLRPIEEVFPDRKRLYTVLSKNDGFIHQGILASPRGNPLFSELIKRVLETPKFEGQGLIQSKWDKELYHSFTKQFYDTLTLQVYQLTSNASSDSVQKLKAGVMAMNGNAKYPVTLHKEHCFSVGEGGCSRGDRYGDCCTIRDVAGRILFVTRFQSFYLDKSMHHLKEADLFYAGGRSDEAKRALYSAVDMHQGNWEAMLRWGLSLLEGINTATESSNIGDNQKGFWAIGQCMLAVLLPDDPRRTELLTTVALAGHEDLAMMMEKTFHHKFQALQAIEEKTSTLAVTRTSTNGNDSDGDHSEVDAWVTLVTTPDYWIGAAALGRSILATYAHNEETTNDYDRQDRPVLVALVSGGSEMESVADKLIAVGYDHVIPVEPLSCAPLANQNNDDNSRFETACTKLHIFNLTQFRLVVYLDSDVIVLHQSANTLFHIRHHLTQDRPFAAAPEALSPSLFNTGVLVVQPSLQRFKELRDGLQTGKAYDGADQGYLNAAFPNWFSWSIHHRLSPRFNFAQMVGHLHLPAMHHYENEDHGIVIMHFLGSDKPWISAHMRSRPIATALIPYYNKWKSFSQQCWQILKRNHHAHQSSQLFIQ